MLVLKLNIPKHFVQALPVFECNVIARPGNPGRGNLPNMKNYTNLNYRFIAPQGEIASDLIVAKSSQ